MKRTQGSLGVFVRLLAALLIHLVIAVQFDSWKQPLVVLLTIPLSVVGVTLGLLLPALGQVLTFTPSIAFEVVGSGGAQAVDSSDTGVDDASVSSSTSFGCRRCGRLGCARVYFGRTPASGGGGGSKSGLCQPGGACMSSGGSSLET